MCDLLNCRIFVNYRAAINRCGSLSYDKAVSMVVVELANWLCAVHCDKINISRCAQILTLQEIYESLPVRELGAKTFFYDFLHFEREQKHRKMRRNAKK